MKARKKKKPRLPNVNNLYTESKKPDAGSDRRQVFACLRPASEINEIVSAREAGSRLRQWTGKTGEVKERSIGRFGEEPGEQSANDGSRDSDQGSCEECHVLISGHDRTAIKQDEADNNQ